MVSRGRCWCGSDPEGSAATIEVLVHLPKFLLTPECGFGEDIPSTMTVLFLTENLCVAHGMPILGFVMVFFFSGYLELLLCKVIWAFLSIGD
jgi:hypothetical protein